MKKADIKNLFYITHIRNIPSILKEGILSHSSIEKLIEEKKIRIQTVYNKEIIRKRKHKIAPDGNNLWHFANLYFQPRNPMLYKVISEKGRNDIVILCIDKKVMDQEGAFISIGNAASHLSEILPTDIGYEKILKTNINREWWKEEDGSKREIMAECLIPHKVKSEYIYTIYTANHETANKVKRLIKPAKIEIVCEPRIFFLPQKRIKVIEKLYLIKGDMFFSEMHTLTISVNTVGIMGKGLASRAKYQFPDVYIVYQDVCRNKKLTMGKPYLYKRESSIDSELADEPLSLKKVNRNQWFLLFPTKRHWREKSDILGIEEGLQWIQDNYKAQGIDSLAIPALGCGLGLLSWKDVGPLMCKYLSKLDIPVSIYLPSEKEISNEFLTKEYLLI